MLATRGKDLIQIFVLDFLVHRLGYLLGAERSEVPSYLKGGFTGTVGSNKIICIDDIVLFVHHII